jgi:hypothetical protein
MKKIIASAFIWCGLWAAGMFLSSGWNAKENEVWLFYITPAILTIAHAVWGMVSAKGGVGTIAGIIIGMCLGIAASIGSAKLGAELASEIRRDRPMEKRIMWMIAGGLFGGLVGACGEWIRQGKRQQDELLSNPHAENTGQSE